MNEAEQAELVVLGSADSDGWFGVGLRGLQSSELNAAFRRGLNMDWYTFVDFGVPADAQELVKYYKLTAAGKKRLHILSGRNIELTVDTPWPAAEAN